MNTTPKYTKGPWGRNIKPASKYPIVYAGRNTHVAQVLKAGLTEDEVEANCSLIAAAPDLIEAAKLVLDARALGDRDDEAVALGKLQDAIAKAEGK